MLNIIVAISKNFIIGNDNKIPWNKPEDMKYFKEKTIGSKMNAIIMGYNTWKSIGKILKDRINIIIDRNVDNGTSNDQLKPDNSYFINNLHNAIISCKQQDNINDIWIIGGQSVYLEAIERDDIDNIYITKIDISCDGNKYFPRNLVNYNLKMSERSDKDPELTYLVYERNSKETQYLQLIEKVLSKGIPKDDRTGTGIISYFGTQMRYNLEDEFPLLTTKKMFLRGIVEELLWFLRGETDAKILQKKKVHIWDANTSREYLDSIGLKEREEGDAGPIYGFNFRHFGAEYIDCNTNYTGNGFDQFQNVINLIKTNPNSRRILINLWNPRDLDKVALPPCHVLYQFWVNNDKLSCSMYQRSGDIGLGIPFNIASASLLTHIIAKLTGLKPFEFIHTIGDTHIYNNHIEPLKEQLNRKPYKFPKLHIKDRQQKNITDFTYEDFILEEYKHHPSIKMAMS